MEAPGSAARGHWPGETQDLELHHVLWVLSAAARQKGKREEWTSGASILKARTRLEAPHNHTLCTESQDLFSLHKGKNKKI